MIEKAKIVKNKDVVKKPSKTLLKVAGVFLGAVIGASSLFIAGLGVSQSKVNLPTRNQAIKNTQTLGVENYSYASWIDNQDAGKLSKIKNQISDRYITRLALPPNGEPIKLNINFPIDGPQKQALINMCNNINYIFGEGKTDLKFELNFSPTTKDIMNIYNINYRLKEDLGTEVLGRATQDTLSLSHNGVVTSFGGEICVLDDHLKDDSYSKLLLFEIVQTHELMHMLGFGDAYIQVRVGDLNENFKSIMRSGPSSHFIQKNDVAILLSNYSNLNDETSEKIINFVNNYKIEDCLSYAQKDILSKTIQNITTESMRGLFDSYGIKYDENWEPELNFDETIYTKGESIFVKYGSYNPTIFKDKNEEEIKRLVNLEGAPNFINYNGALCNASSNAVNVKFGNYQISVVSYDGKQISGIPYQMCTEEEYNEIISNMQLNNKENKIVNVEHSQNLTKKINPLKFYEEERSL